MNYKILDIKYEPIWGILNINGYCDCNKEEFENISLYYKDKFIAELKWGFRYTNKFIAYKGEILIKEENFDENQISVHYNIKNITYKENYKEVNSLKELTFFEKFSRTLRIFKYKYFINKIEPKRVGREKNILLFIHNLEYEERIQKLRCFENLNKELKNLGWKLIIVHHSLNKLETNIETIELLDMKMPFFYKILNYDILKKFAKDFEISVDFMDAFKKSFNHNTIYPLSYDQVKNEFYKTKYIIDKFKPYVILNWHEWSSLQFMSKSYADFMSISNFSVHEGALFDTLEIDQNGELGESWIFDDIDKFNNLLLDNEDISKAKEFLKNIKERNLNRKYQNKEGFVKELLKPLKGKTIIFYAGVNDAQTGMLPVWYEKAKLHSPEFIDTYDALDYLKKLAHKNDWYILFKSHPNVPLRKDDFIDNRVIYVKEANILECINETDVTITLLSTLSYDVLINKKPLVLLGKNLMSKSNSAYEINDIYDVEDTIKDAINKINFNEKEDGFILHVARLLKYYYFPYSYDSTKYCYRNFKDTARYLIKNSSKGNFFE